MPIEKMTAQGLLEAGELVQIMVNNKVVDIPATQNAIDEELRRIQKDLNERPALESPRTLNLNFKFTPIANRSGDRLLEVEMTCDVDSKVPKQQLPSVRLAAEKGDLYYRKDSLDDPRQMTLRDAVPQANAAADAAAQNLVPQGA